MFFHSNKGGEIKTMVIKLSSVLKVTGAVLFVIGISMFLSYFVRVERRLNDLDFRVKALDVKYVVFAPVKEVVKVATSTPVPSKKPTPKLIVK